MRFKLRSAAGWTASIVEVVAKINRVTLLIMIVNQIL